jgi:hypothetical protein
MRRKRRKRMERAARMKETGKAKKKIKRQTKATTQTKKMTRIKTKTTTQMKAKMKTRTRPKTKKKKNMANPLFQTDPLPSEVDANNPHNHHLPYDDQAVLPKASTSAQTDIGSLLNTPLAKTTSSLLQEPSSLPVEIVPSPA